MKGSRSKGYTIDEKLAATMSAALGLPMGSFPRFLPPKDFSVPAALGARVTAHHGGVPDAELEAELKKLNIDQLKGLLKKFGLKVGGTKPVLLARLLSTEAEPPKVVKRAKDSDGESGEAPAAPKRKRRMQQKSVDKLLEQVGGGACTSNCLKAAIAKGFVVIDPLAPNPLDVVVASGPCDNCGQIMTATVATLLQQPDYAGMDYEDGCENATVECPHEGCRFRTYVTRICEGKAQVRTSFRGCTVFCEGVLFAV